MESIKVAFSRPPHYFSWLWMEALKREQVSAAVRALLPQHGLYAAGGGINSSAWRVIISTDSKPPNFTWGTSSTKNASSCDAMMQKNGNGTLSEKDVEKLMKVAEEAKKDQPAKPLMTMSYDEILVICEGDVCHKLNGYGPIQAKHAAELIKKMRSAAGL